MENNNPEQASKENCKKITVGFKCDPSLKAKLTKEAQQLGITISEYSESIISNHFQTQNNDVNPPPTKQAKTLESQSAEQPRKTCFNDLETRLTNLMEEQVSPVLVSIEEIKELLISHGAAHEKSEATENSTDLIEENENLKRELSEIAGNEGLQQLYEKYKGKTLEYQTPGKEKRKIKVSSYSDVITALVETIIDKQ